MSPSVLPPLLLSSTAPVLSLPFPASTLSALLSLLTSGSASAPSPGTGREVEEAASCLGIALS